MEQYDRIDKNYYEWSVEKGDYIRRGESAEKIEKKIRRYNIGKKALKTFLLALIGIGSVIVLIFIAHLQI